MQTKDTSYDFLSLNGEIPRGNVTKQVTDTLRSAIVTLSMAPGDVIDKAIVCERMGVSRFPVSEALSRLQAEGLVDILPQRGTRVSYIRISDVREYMLIRKAVESEAVNALVSGGVPDELITCLADCIHGQRAAAEQNDREGFHQYDTEFHELLYSTMQFTKIKAIIDSARANVDRARRLLNSPRRLMLTLTEHEEIYNAIVAKDAERAAAGMRNHIGAVLIEILAFAKSAPEQFADGSDNSNA